MQACSLVVLNAATLLLLYRVLSIYLPYVLLTVCSSTVTPALLLLVMGITPSSVASGDTEALQAESPLPGHRQYVSAVSSINR